MPAPQKGKRPVPVQERYVGNGWAVLLCGLLFQRASGGTVSKALEEVLDRWPTWERMRDDLGVHYEHDWSIDVKNDVAWRWLYNTIEPCGLQNRRIGYLMKWLLRFHVEGLPKTRKDVESLVGAGAYTADCWSLFIERDFSKEPVSEDFMLKAYWDWVTTHR